MIVRFESTETGEILMFAATARTLLQIIGKETTARGVFVVSEMPAAAERLRQAISEAGRPAEPEDEEEATAVREPVIGLSQRAWPLLDMLERTARCGAEAHVVWQAAKDF
ncbi:MAG: DUF1840 domain-containing protein [Dechloromonas sp.]|nr:DUF1840 domain-containing protein [Dechloromonas sp.]